MTAELMTVTSIFRMQRQGHWKTSGEHKEVVVFCGSKKVVIRENDEHAVAASSKAAWQAFCEGQHR